jgi:hypothetical protein
VARLIQQCHQRIQPPIERVIYCYNAYQDLFTQLQRESPVPIEMVNTLEGVDSKAGVPTLLIVDDQMNVPEVEKTVADFFIKDSHHGNMSIIYMVQNVFHTSKYHRTISLNAHYIWLGKNPRSADQILHLAMQTFPKQHHFLREAYQDATAEPYGYLFLDFKQTTPDAYRVKTSVLEEDHIVYVPKKKI